MTVIVWTYFAYLIISIGLTIWVANTLSKNGRIFLVDAFGQNEALADSVNHLLVVGFYLINIGYVTLFLKTYAIVETLRDGIELLSAKIGWVLVILGIMHFFNLYVFSRIRKRGLMKNTPPPIPPTGQTPTQAYTQEYTQPYDPNNQPYNGE